MTETAYVPVHERIKAIAKRTGDRYVDGERESKILASVIGELHGLARSLKEQETSGLDALAAELEATEVTGEFTTTPAKVRAAVQSEIDRGAFAPSGGCSTEGTIERIVIFLTGRGSGA